MKLLLLLHCNKSLTNSHVLIQESVCCPQWGQIVTLLVNINECWETMKRGVTLWWSGVFTKIREVEKVKKTVLPDKRTQWENGWSTSIPCWCSSPSTYTHTHTFYLIVVHHSINCHNSQSNNLLRLSFVCGNITLKYYYEEPTPRSHTDISPWSTVTRTWVEHLRRTECESQERNTLWEIKNVSPRSFIMCCRLTSFYHIISNHSWDQFKISISPLKR